MGADTLPEQPVQMGADTLAEQPASPTSLESAATASSDQTPVKILDTPVQASVDRSMHANSQVLAEQEQHMDRVPDAVEGNIEDAVAVPKVTGSPTLAPLGHTPNGPSVVATPPPLSSSLAPSGFAPRAAETPAAGPGLLQLLSMATRSSSKKCEGDAEVAGDETLRGARGSILSYSPGHHRMYDRATSRLGLHTPSTGLMKQIEPNQLGIKTTAGAAAAAIAATSPRTPETHSKLSGGASEGGRATSHRSNSPAARVAAIAAELAAIAQDEQLQQQDEAAVGAAGWEEDAEQQEEGVIENEAARDDAKTKSETIAVPEGDTSTVARRHRR
eukprot:COSAG02_NODE_3299_length_6989_cov_8.204935_4_plen_331_part_00